MVKIKRYLLFFWPVLLWLIWTWPLVLNFSTSIYSDYLGDSAGWMSAYRNPALLQPSDFLAPVFGWVPWWLSKVLDAVPIYNLMVLFGWLGTFWGGWWFLRSLCLSSRAAFFGTTAFMLAPTRIWQSFEWFNYAQWGFIFLYLSFLMRLVGKLRKSGSQGIVGAAALSGVAFALVLTENSYHGFMIFWLTVGVAGFVLAKGSTLKGLNPYLALLVLGVSALLFSLPVLQSFMGPAVGGEVSRAIEASRGFDDRIAFSARPWHYFIPDINHPLVGDWALEIHHWIWGRPPYFLTEAFFPKEHTLYLGLTLLGLAAYGIYKGCRQHRGYETHKNYESYKFWVGLFTFLAVLMFTFSLPPLMTLRGIKFYFPSHFLYQFFPQVRAYARFGTLTFICVTVVACFGLESLLGAVKGNPLRGLPFTVLLGLLVLEFVNFPPFHNFSTELPPTYQWLAEQKGDFSYAEFPPRRDSTDALFQPAHGKTVWNATRPLPGEERNSLPNYQSAEFPGFLRKEGVRYIFFHRYQEKSDKQKARESWGYPIWGNQFGRTPEGTIAEVEAWFISSSDFDVAADFGETVVLELN